MSTVPATIPSTTPSPENGNNAAATRFQLLATYLRPHRAGVILLGLILFASIGMQITTPILAARFIDNVTSAAPLNDLIRLAIATIILALVGQVLAVAATGVAERVGWDATNTLRIDLTSHLLRLDRSFHSTHTQGELIERVDGDVRLLARFFSAFIVGLGGNALLLLAMLGVLWRVDWMIGLTLSGFTVLAMIVMLRIRVRATPDWEADRQANADFFGFLGEYLAGLEDVRAAGARGFVLRRCAELMRSWLRITSRAQMWGYAMIASSQGIFGLALAAALGLAAIRFHAGEISLGAVFLVFRLTDMLRGPTEEIRDEIQDFQQADASIHRVQSLLAERPRIVDGPMPALPSGALAIDLDRVGFTYPNGRSVLHEISLTIPAGRKLGIVGRTGSGKTTLTNLVPRFLDPTAGVIRIGGIDLHDVTLHGVRSRIGIVGQEVQILDASLRDNLTLFAPPSPALDDRLREILATLDLGDWLQSLPDGLDTRLGAGGIGLSAGQMQVLSCARLLLREPDIVILDEASSRLDPASERMLHRAFDLLLAGRTALIVAHRLATLTLADDILVLSDGRLMEHGPREVLANDPSSRFAALLRLDAEWSEMS
ncbi:MAG: ABC transporter ATP-binding protein [Thermomicrobiales bacterium]